ncbi:MULTISPECIES: ABC transporter ATP-binding protein [Pseudanabaena]|uniref:ABC transporter ATP-binding protein n=1 Tax=Pseudanabaena TaxID=1152 RepID=UPI00247A49AE|nr:MULTISPECIES: ABC transporter ATP-binding protein [Pseudanabaena]MEA5486142.1 ABC transporter ATP-binding protein [Pseudanabaena sp. CCNP1317]WGS74368.1 ABC transporter ATP-binding protein [Pseudanabaena galeata CCNP1313]
MQKPIILSLENITKQFTKDGMPAVEQVSLRLNEGDILGFLGPSGCGKTTLLRLIAGLERPQDGKITIDGKIVGDRHNWIPVESRDVGLVFQDYALFPHLTVLKNVAFGLKKLDKHEIKQRVWETLKLVQLTGLEQRYPHELSGGQQQRVALARALATQPKLLLLDEPLSNLDVQVRLQLREEMRSIIKAAGTSAIFVTHDQEEALAICDVVGVMRQGHLEQIGTPEELYNYPKSRFVAEFVTQANFLPAYRQEDIWSTEIGKFKIKTMRSQLTGEIMIRQEDFTLKPHAPSPLVIHSRRFLGREYHYCLYTPSGQKINVRTGIDTSIPEGTPVQLTMTNSKVRIFESLG